MEGRDVIVNSGAAAQRCGPLKITQDRVVTIMMRIINTDGLETARTMFKLMNDIFSTERGWAETADEVYAVLAEAQRRQHSEQLAEDLARLRASAPSILMVNSNEATGVKDLNNSLANNFIGDVQTVFNEIKTVNKKNHGEGE